MSNFYWRVFCCPLKRRLPPIAESSRLSKRRKTFHGGDAEAHQRPTTSSTTQPDDRERREDPFCREDRQELENPSDGFSFHQVFLSHSGSQKSFVEQLFVDLQREQISCFFDKDPQSLPKGEEFPPRIFEAALNCRVGVVVLSHEFISSKWPMLELCQFVRAKKNSPNGRPKILPVFFKLSPESLHQKLQDKDSLKRSWQELLKAQQRPIDLDEWLNALEALRPVNGIVYNEQESEVDYRAKVVSSIRNLLPPVLRYDDSNVQGKERLCKEVARMFNNTPWGEDGVKIAGLYGVAGIGKTTLAKLACNFYSDGFDGRVLHVELGKGRAIERLKSALRVLTSASEMLVNSITDIEQGWCLFNNRMDGAKVFLALDNVSDVNESMDEATKYLRAVCSARNQSMVLLTARSSIILRRFILEEERSCVHVPSLSEEEAIPLLLERLSNEKQDIAKKCALKCYFSYHGIQHYNHLSVNAYHPLALKAFGVSLYDSCPDISRWIDIQNSSLPCRTSHEVIFDMFEESFQRLSEDYKNIFMFLCLYVPKSHMDLEEVYKWLALVCNTNVEHIKFAVDELHRKALVERVMESYNRLYIHDLHMEFAEKKADGTGKWISLKKIRDIPTSLQENDRPRFSAMKFDNCHFECPGFLNKALFRNVLVLHLQDMPQLKILDLSPMRILRSITIVGCGDMQEIRGLKSLTSLVYFVVRDCSPYDQISGIERLVALQHLQMEGRLSETTTRLSPLSWTLFPPLRSANFVGNNST